MSRRTRRFEIREARDLPPIRLEAESFEQLYDALSTHGVQGANVVATHLWRTFEQIPMTLHVHRSAHNISAFVREVTP